VVYWVSYYVRSAGCRVVVHVTVTTSPNNTVGWSVSLMYTVFRKKHALTYSLVSLWIICGFKQKLQWIYPRIDRFWLCKN